MSETKKWPNLPKGRFFVRVMIVDAKDTSKVFAKYTKGMHIDKLEGYCQSYWWELLEGTEWESDSETEGTIPKETSTHSIKNGWKWNAIISGLDAKKPTVFSPEGGRITKSYRRAVRKRPIKRKEQNETN